MPGRLERKHQVKKVFFSFSAICHKGNTSIEIRAKANSGFEKVRQKAKLWNGIPQQKTSLFSKFFLSFFFSFHAQAPKERYYPSKDWPMRWKL